MRERLGATETNRRGWCSSRIAVLFPLLLYGELIAQTIPRYEVLLSDSQASSGYYFIHATRVNGSGTSWQMILDSRGNLVYARPFARASIDFKLHANGKMSYSGTLAGPNTARFYFMDSAFVVVDSVMCTNGILTDSHDIQVLSNGHYLLLGYEFQTMDLSSYRWFSGNGSPGSTTARVKCGVIQALDENRNLVFQWRAYDHFQFGDVQEERLFDPADVDWTHLNSVALDADGNILLSSRWLSEITKINRQTGAIIWRFGGKRNQFTFANDPNNGTYGQHDVRRITNGHVTMFDNGKAGVPLHPARAVEYILDEQNRSAALAWSYTFNVNSTSSALGNVQRLAGGNSVIGWGTLRNANVMFTVVKPDGNPVMLIRFPDSSITYRAFNYATLPWRLVRPAITCFSSGGNFFLDAGAGYSSYLWSTGATTRTIQVNNPDTYYVVVPYGSDGFISSPKVVIANMNNPCDQVASVRNDGNDVPERFLLRQNHPNPFNPATAISFAMSQSAYVGLNVFDVLGRKVATLVNGELPAGEHKVDFDGAVLSSGVYFYRLQGGGFIDTKKLVLTR